MRDRVQTAGCRLRMFGIDYLVYALIDLVVDRKFPLIETLASHLEELEDEALGHPDQRHARATSTRRGARWWPSTASNGRSARPSWR